MEAEGISKFWKMKAMTKRPMARTVQMEARDSSGVSVRSSAGCGGRRARDRWRAGRLSPEGVDRGSGWGQKGWWTSAAPVEVQCNVLTRGVSGRSGSTDDLGQRTIWVSGRCGGRAASGRGSGGWTRGRCGWVARVWSVVVSESAAADSGSRRERIDEEGLADDGGCGNEAPVAAVLAVVAVVAEDEVLVWRGCGARRGGRGGGAPSTSGRRLRDRWR